MNLYVSVCIVWIMYIVGVCTYWYVLYVSACIGYLGYFRYIQIHLIHTDTEICIWGCRYAHDMHNAYLYVSETRIHTRHTWIFLYIQICTYRPMDIGGPFSTTFSCLLPPLAASDGSSVPSINWQHPPSHPFGLRPLKHGKFGIFDRFFKT